MIFRTSSEKPETNAAFHSSENHNSKSAHLYCTAYRTTAVILGNFPLSMNPSSVRSITAHLYCIDRRSGVQLRCCGSTIYVVPL